ncbi:tetratricopeptide repeat-containing sulfotransferase family protein [Viridibacterium curvum]|uniref:Sulfotransferase n=1 Tax=Viridibacterium curvum TaxID=1101404 RepID=A0ABP9R121_9RHOO
MPPTHSSLEAGSKLMASGQLDRAYEHLVRALEESPENPLVLLQLGKLSLLAGMADEAWNFLRIAIEQDSRITQEIRNLADEFKASNRPADAQAIHQFLNAQTALPQAPSVERKPDLPFELTFCVGAPRSGTTVIGSLLSEGPTAFPMLPECSFITQLIRQFRDILTGADQARFEAFAKTPGDLINVYRPALEGFLRNAHSHFVSIPATHLILKDPELSTYLDCLQFFFPRFKVVCVVRDPRDVVASSMRVNKKLGNPRTLEEVIAHSFSYYQCVAHSSLARKGDVHFIHFERVLRKEEDEFARLESYLGYAVGRHGFGKVFFEFDRSDATYSDNYGKALRPLTEDRSLLGEEGERRVEEVFAAFNRTWHWW